MSPRFPSRCTLPAPIRAPSADGARCWNLQAPPHSPDSASRDCSRRSGAQCQTCGGSRFITVTSSISRASRRRRSLRTLERLLDHVPGSDAADGNGQLLLTVPRPGTISPWSSKATDIAHVCGLAFVRRIERGRLWRLESESALAPAQLLVLAAALHDPMTEAVLPERAAAARLFESHEPRPLRSIALGGAPAAALARANANLGLALSTPEIGVPGGCLCAAGARSDGCRSDDVRAGEQRALPPQDLQRGLGHRRVCRAAHAVRDDPAHARPEPRRRAVRLQRQRGRDRGPGCRAFLPGSRPIASYRWHDEPADILIKVETHNHPTAISPFPGAATGSGGEIRDEGATGLGAKPKAGLVGFTVSNLRIPGFEQPWEIDHGRSPRIASALDIMLEGPIGAAAFNNEFGRPGILGYFRTFEMRLAVGSGRRHPRLSQADHDRRRTRERAAHARRRRAKCRSARG